MVVFQATTNKRKDKAASTQSLTLQLESSKKPVTPKLNLRTFVPDKTTANTPPLRLRSVPRRRGGLSEFFKIQDEGALERLKRINVGNVSNLPQLSRSDAHYRGCDENLFIRPGDEPIGTINAYACVILVVVAKDSKGNARRGGMIHADISWSEGKFQEFLQRLKKKAGPKTVFEISMLSGSGNIAVDAFKASEKFIAENPGSGFYFVSCDLDSNRIDGAVLTLQGNRATIYYIPQGLVSTPIK